MIIFYKQTIVSYILLFLNYDGFLTHLLFDAVIVDYNRLLSSQLLIFLAQKKSRGL